MTIERPLAPLSEWALSPDVEHLNHGSFGASPRQALAAADSWRARLEAAPMRFFVMDWQGELDRARAALASYVGAPPDRLAFVPSATTGVAIALGSTPLAAGDEILVTDHGYRACMHQVRRIAAATGARPVTVTLPIPFDDDAAVAAIRAAVTPRTRLALLDHVTSPTALVLPIARIVPALAALGITIVIDGAHAPGQLPLDVSALLAAGVTWYAGNNHKWLCAPKGTGFVVASTGAPPVRPVVTSHGMAPEYGPANRFHAELDWMGTHDPAPHLAVPAAIEAVARLGGGWPAVFDRNHRLAVAMRDQLAAALGGARVAPDHALGTMAAVPITLPAGVGPLELERRLLADGWEVPIIGFARGPMIRVSAHLYNHLGQIDALARHLRALGVRGDEGAAARSS